MTDRLFGCTAAAGRFDFGQIWTLQVTSSAWLGQGVPCRTGSPSMRCMALVLMCFALHTCARIPGTKKGCKATGVCVQVLRVCIKMLTGRHAEEACPLFSYQLLLMSAHRQGGLGAVCFGADRTLHTHHALLCWCWLVVYLLPDAAAVACSVGVWVVFVRWQQQQRGRSEQRQVDSRNPQTRPLCVRHSRVWIDHSLFRPTLCWFGYVCVRLVLPCGLPGLCPTFHCGSLWVVRVLLQPDCWQVGFYRGRGLRSPAQQEQEQGLLLG